MGGVGHRHVALARPRVALGMLRPAKSSGLDGMPESYILVCMRTTLLIDRMLADIRVREEMWKMGRQVK